VSLKEKDSLGFVSLSRC